MWSLLITTLPTQPSAVRLRVWRTLKQLGCASLRDGAYLLPDSQTPAFEALATQVREHGGSASVLALAARSPAQQQELLALFDRSAAYADWRDTVLALQNELPSLDEAQARKRQRAVAEELLELQRTDHVPGPASAHAPQELEQLRQAVRARFSPGEPRSGPAVAIARLKLGDYQGRRWATRQRPGIDRMACTWLIRRFIDPAAQFVWLATSAEGAVRTPRGAVGFDYDGARFTHVGARVSAEVLAASFGLEGDPALSRIGLAVRFLDVGGIPVPEAEGLGAVLAGLQQVHDDDDTLVAAAGSVFDALYASPRFNPNNPNGRKL